MENLFNDFAIKRLSSLKHKNQQMKKIFFNLFLLASLGTLVACSGNSPESAAKNFLKKMHKADFEGAKEYATTDTKSMLSMLESFGARDRILDESKEQGSLNITVVDTQIDGDKAVCKVELKYSDTDKVDTQTIKLIKKDDKWLVNMGKEDSKKEDLKPKN